VLGSKRWGSARVAAGALLVLSVAGCTGGSSGEKSSDADSLADASAVPSVGDRDDFGDPLGTTSLLAPEKQRLIADLPEEETCEPDAPAPIAVPGSGETVLQVVYVVGGCLRVEQEVVSAADADARRAELKAMSDVVAVDSGGGFAGDVDVSGAETADDPDIGGQRWWLDDLRVDELDALEVRTSPIVVGVIDSGKIDDSNDDFEGLVTVRASDEQTAVTEVDSHGTHVAGIIGARAGNGKHGRGVARVVEFADAPGGKGRLLSAHIIWAVGRGAKVINMSLCELDYTFDLPCSSTPNEATAAAVDYARKRGVTLVAAAMNCGPKLESAAKKSKSYRQCDGEVNRVGYPAAYPGVIGVGAYSENGNVADFSSRNRTVDLSAPGDGIVSTVLNNTTGSMSGTSQAAPMVTGAIAALLAHRPDLPAGKIVAALYRTARDAGVAGWDQEFGAGRIDPVAAAEYLDETYPAQSVEPAAYMVDYRGPDIESAVPVVIKVTLDGTVTELWREDAGTKLDLIDVSADGTRIVAQRSYCPDGEAVYCGRFERNLLDGTENPDPETTLPWEGLKPASPIVDAANALSVNGAWVAVQLPDGVGAVIGGSPLVLIKPNYQGGPLPDHPEAYLDLGNTGVYCEPVHGGGPDHVIAQCLDPVTRSLVTDVSPDYPDADLLRGGCCIQLWEVPLDGGAPTQLTRIAYTAEDALVPFAPARLHVDSSGGRWVQFYGDCGARAVRQLLPDGQFGPVSAVGEFVGVAGRRLITVDSWNCSGFGRSRILARDFDSDSSVTLYDSDASDNADEGGVSVSGVLWLPKR